MIRWKASINKLQSSKSQVDLSHITSFPMTTLLINFLFLFSIFPSVAHCQTDEPIEWYCVGMCYFKPGEITRKRLEQWPRNCSDICSDIVINSNCDASYLELKETFKNMKKLRGGIRIEGAKFENLSFLPANVNWHLLDDVLIITDNPQLENIDPLLNMCSTDNIQVLNNPKLNASALCDSDCYDKRLSQIAGNLGNCACSGGTVNSSTIGRLKNCKYISGSLIITDIDDNSNLSALSKVRTIAGDLEVTRTNLTSLSFLKSLQGITSRDKDYNYKPRNTSIINIHENYKLIRMELNSLGSLYSLSYSRFTMNLKHLHPEFCLTIDEIYFFLQSKVRFDHLEARFCRIQEDRTDFDNKKLCFFGNMKKLEYNCTFIYGDVLVDSGDEKHVWKLKKVTTFFGSVTVRNTTLSNFTFLKNLNAIINLNKSQPVMQFLNNPNLQDFDIPWVEMFLTNGNNKVIIDNNHPNVFKTLKACMIFQFKSQTNVSINGQPCKSIPKTLPDGYGYDLDHMDYSEYSDEDWYYYDGDFYMFDNNALPDFEDPLRKVNVIVAITCLLINTFNLIILLQKKLRENFIYILMIGVSISDILMVIAFVLDYLLDAGWLYELNLCDEKTYTHVLMRAINECIQVTTRRYSSFLALLMAFLRTLSVTFPLNTLLIRISKPKPIIQMSLVLLAICSFYDGIQYYLSTDIVAPRDYTSYSYENPDCNNTYVGYINNGNILHALDILDIRSLSVIIDTTTTIITAFLYLLVTILLLYQLRMAHKRRNALRSDNDKADGTSKLITLMAITFFVSEVLYGAYQWLTSFYLPYKRHIQYFGSSFNYLFWTLLIINSNIHCLICFFMSSQYREVVRQIFWRKEKKETVINMATKSKSSSSRS